jgi:hypothetical protein
MKRRCSANGCQAMVAPSLLMCGQHWRMVPYAIQTRVWQHYRKGQEETLQLSVEYLRAAADAVEAVATKEGQPLDNSFRRAAVARARPEAESAAT